VIRESRIWPDKGIVFDDHPVPQLDPGFHGNAVTDNHLFFDEHMITDIAVATDDGAVEDMGERPDSRSVSHFGSLAKALWVDEVVHVEAPPKLSAVKTMDWGRPLVFSKVRHR